jgi:hypothetical protein
MSDLAAHFVDAANLVRESRTTAEIATARCARDSEWDLEAHYRSRAEAFAEAEAILRRHAAELSEGGVARD